MKQEVKRAFLSEQYDLGDTIPMTHNGNATKRAREIERQVFKKDKAAKAMARRARQAVLRSDQPTPESLIFLQPEE